MTDTREAVDAARDYAAAVYTETGRIHRAIDAFLSKLSESHCIVPVEPTEAMVMHGAAALDPMTVYMGGPPEGRKRQALMAYAAMIQAASGKE